MNNEISVNSSDSPQTSPVSPSQISQRDEGYQRFFKQNPLPMWIYDLETLAFLAVNEAAVEYYGYTRDEFLAMTIAEIRPTEDVPTLMENPLAATVDFASPSIQEILGVAPNDPFSIWLDRLHPEDRPQVIEAYYRTATHADLFDMTMRIYHPRKAQWRWIRAVSNPVFDDLGKATHFNGLMVDVTELKVAHEEMERLASYDPLTGLPNRRLFRDRLDQALKIAHRHGQTLALLYLDLDNFKRVNDSLGHDAGDRLLQTVAERIRAYVRNEDTVSRLGGDEFVVLLSAVHGSTASDRVAHKILDALRLPVWLEGQEVVVTGSIGITIIPEDSADPAVILRNADLAMYRAKETGRDRYEFFQVKYTSVLLERLREIGVRISVDDFGTGYSSLSYLKRLPVNSLKVDCSFVHDIPHDKNDMEITAAVIAMAHKLELSVVAEGVETPLQLEFLRTNSCDLAQGFLFGRPMLPEQLAEL